MLSAPRSISAPLAAPRFIERSTLDVRRWTFLLALLITASARAWDAGGHMLTGQIAWELSSPQVRIFNALTGALLDAFFAVDPAFTGGLYVAGNA